MPDFAELKKKHKETWALGEHDVLAEGLHPVTDHVLRIARPRPGERVLDVATGTGNTAIAARERGARVTGVDLTPELLAIARKKAEAEGFDDIRFDEGDAEALPYPDASFDLVVSTCGHMFAPDQARVAAELARVTRPGGRVVFQAWTPDGGLGAWFRLTNRHVPPPAGVPSAFEWGLPEKVEALLGPAFEAVSFSRGDCPQFGDTPADVLRLYTRYYGPTIRALSQLDVPARKAFEADALAFLASWQAADGKVRWGREYLVTSARRV